MTNRNELVHVSADSDASLDELLRRPEIERVFADARALETRTLMAIKVDVLVTATTCIGVGRRVSRFRAELAQMPGFDLHALDTLPATGLALTDAVAAYNAAIKPPVEIKALAARGTALRRLFRSTAEALARAGVFDLRQVEARRGIGTGYVRIAEALQMWAFFFRKNTDWARVKANSSLTDDLVKEAHEVADEIYELAGAHKRDPKRIAEAKELVRRVFTLAVSRYNEVRRGMIFLRQPFGDVDQHVPSLFAKGPRRKGAGAGAGAGAAEASGATTNAVTTDLAGLALPAPRDRGQ